MKSKLFLCAALAAALYVTPSYAADYSAQVVSFSQEDPDLNGCTILGFCGNKIFILDPHYDEQYTSDSEEYAQCKEIVTSIKKSFISYIKDAGTVE